MTSEGRGTTLADLAALGCVTDEWKRWQQGDCYTYAHALRRVRPSLRLGALDQGRHLFAHDDEYAYDSAGRHPMPYRGIDDTSDPEFDVEDNCYDGPWEDAIPDAIAHIERHGILTAPARTVTPDRDTPTTG